MSELSTIAIYGAHEPGCRVLANLLEGAGVRGVVVTRAAEVRDLVSQGAVDLVLLDLKPPFLTGELFAELLKGDAPRRQVPILVVAEPCERLAVAEAVHAGADGFLIRPIDPMLLRVEIELLLAGKRTLDYEGACRRRLETELAEKGQQLTELDRKLRQLDQAKSDFLRLIAHEMRTPLNGLLGSIGLLHDNLAAEERESPWGILRTSAERLRILVEDATLLSRLQVAEAGVQEGGKANLAMVLEMGLRRASRCPRLGASAKLPVIPPCEAIVEGDEGLLARAFQGLFQCGMLLAAEGEVPEVRCSVTEFSVEVLIRVHGPLPPPEAKAHFFDLLPGHQVQVAGGNLGLLPALAARIIHLFDGDIELELTPPDLIALRLRLPRFSEESKVGFTGIFFTTTTPQ